MGFLVFRRVVLCESLKKTLGRKTIFSLCWEHAFRPIFMVCTILFANPFDWEWYGSVFHLIFSNHKLKSSSQNSGALSDTRVFGIPFLENMTLIICFIVERFLSDTRITSDQPEKESTSINKNPTPVMYAWSICTRLYGSTSLGYECKEVCVKFLLYIFCIFL